MPRADAAVITDLRAFLMPSGCSKERGGRWLTRTFIACYCMNMEEISFARRICSWKICSKGKKGSGFSFLRYREVPGNFFVWKCCWLELCVNTVFSWACAISVSLIRRRLHYQQRIYKCEDQVKEKNRRIRQVIKDMNTDTGYGRKFKGWGILKFKILQM